MKARNKQKQIKALRKDDEKSYWREMGCYLGDAIQVNASPNSGPFAGSFGVVIGKGTVSKQAVLVAVSAMLQAPNAPHGMLASYIAVQMTKGEFQALGRARFVPAQETVIALRERVKTNALLICTDGFFTLHKTAQEETQPTPAAEEVMVAAEPVA